MEDITGGNRFNTNTLCWKCTEGYGVTYNNSAARLATSLRSQADIVTWPKQA